MKQLLSLILLVFICHVHAQITITGILTTADDGLPLPGANVIIKGTSNGVQTDFDGKYSISVMKSDILVFSYVGYLTTEVLVEDKFEINVSLEPDKSVLDEVVVVGYGTTTKKAYAGSASVVKVEKIKEGESVYNNPASGQLTAAELNDLLKWKEWKKALSNNEYKKVQNEWGFYLENRIEVTVKNQDGIPLNNVEVRLYNQNNDRLMVARTNMEGRVFMFKDLNQQIMEDCYTVQVIHDKEIVGKKITKKHKVVNFVLENNSFSSNNNVDIMFTIDATGSMSDEIAYLKSELKNIISRLDKRIEQKRVALTFYRDHGDAYVTRDFDFESNIQAVQKNLAAQNADGGGDYEEAVEQALKVSMNQSWNVNAKAKLLFLLLDAPPHLTLENVSLIQNQIKEAQRKGIKIIPIVASDANKTVEFLMRFFSISTNGTYVFLTDDSGIGNPHLKPTAKDYKVEKLNDLIVRLIEKYAGVEDSSMQIKI